MAYASIEKKRAYDREHKRRLRAERKDEYNEKIRAYRKRRKLEVPEYMRGLFRGQAKRNYNRHITKKREYARVYMDRWRANNPEKYKEVRKRYALKNVQKLKDSARERLLRTKYNLTLEQYDLLLQVQGGKCRICDATSSKMTKGNLVVDHNHETGEVRGLLCDRCNWAMGMFADNPDLLRKAAAYLETTTGCVSA